KQEAQALQQKAQLLADTRLLADLKERAEAVRTRPLRPGDEESLAQWIHDRDQLIARLQGYREELAGTDDEERKTDLRRIVEGIQDLQSSNQASPNPRAVGEFATAGDFVEGARELIRRARGEDRAKWT